MCCMTGGLFRPFDSTRMTEEQLRTERLDGVITHIGLAIIGVTASIFAGYLLQHMSMPSLYHKAHDAYVLIACIALLGAPTALVSLVDGAVHFCHTTRGIRRKQIEGAES